MRPRIEVVGEADDHEAAAVVAAIQAVIAEEEANARRAHLRSRWRPELPVFEPGSWGVAPRPHGGEEG